MAEKIAFYGGTFDPPHKGHVEIARALTARFSLNRFVFVPANHAPHKKDRIPTESAHRLAMLAAASSEFSNTEISTIELDAPESPYTFETLAKLKSLHPGKVLFFVMGADSWNDIVSWRHWEEVLSTINVIVVTRPDYEISTDHVTDEIRSRIRDVRGAVEVPESSPDSQLIFLTDAVSIQVAASAIRAKIQCGDVSWRSDVGEAVANYIETHQIYK